VGYSACYIATGVREMVVWSSGPACRIGCGDIELDLSRGVTRVSEVAGWTAEQPGDSVVVGLKSGEARVSAASSSREIDEIL